MFTRLPFGKLRRIRLDAAVLLSLGLVCACLWVFVAVADEVAEGDLQQAEEHFMRSLRRTDDPGRVIGPPHTEEIARDLSALGSATVLLTFTVLTVGFLVVAGRRRTALFVSLAVLGGYALSTALKAAFQRPRPDDALHLTHVTSASFPSGHSLLSSVVYVTLGSLLARTVARRREKLFFISAALLLSFLVGLSRIFLGVHYPTDVLSGWTAGIAWALLWSLLAARLQETGALSPPASDGEPAKAARDRRE